MNRGLAPARRWLRTAGLALAALGLVLGAAQALEPTFSDVAYGAHERNVLDFWQAESAAPAPVVVYIHGGGFYEGDKRGFRRQEQNIGRALGAGVSVAAINYRFVTAAPLQDILRDTARAVQFLRAQAAVWNIDRDRIAAWGVSAGAGASLWLACHDDLADPGNADSVLRESTRLCAAGAVEPQASYDFGMWPAVFEAPEVIWWLASFYVSPAYYHFSPLGAVMPRGRRVRMDLDMLGHIDAGDPPIYLSARQEDAPLDYWVLTRLLFHWIRMNVARTEIPNDPALDCDLLHHPAHARAIERRLEQAGVPCTAVYRDTPPAGRISAFDFLLDAVAAPSS